MTCSACFLIQPRTTYLGMAPPTVGWALSCQCLTRKLPHKLAQRPTWWKRVFKWGFLFPDDPGLYQVDKTLTSSVSIPLGSFIIMTNICSVLGICKNKNAHQSGHQDWHVIRLQATILKWIRRIAHVSILPSASCQQRHGVNLPYSW